MHIQLNRALRACAFYAYDYHSFNMRPHRHDSLEIMYVDRGAAQIEWGDKKIRLKKGQLVAIDFGAEHRLYVPDGSNCRILNLEIGYGDQRRENAPFLNEAVGRLNDAGECLVLEDDGRVRDCILRLHRELTDRPQLSLCELYLYEILTLLGVYYVRAVSIGNPHIKRAAAYIAREFTSDIRAADVASACRLSTGYLQRQFKIAMGITLAEYVESLRIARAESLMRTTNLRLTDIAAEAGYNSRQSFFKAFKKSTGLSPSDYLMRQKDAAKQRFIRSPYEE